MYSQNTIPVREILRNYKKIFSRIKETGEGVVVIRDNVPEVAIIPLEDFERIQLEAIKNEAIVEYREGKTRSIETEKDWEEYEKEVLQDAL